MPDPVPPPSLAALLRDRRVLGALLVTTLLVALRGLPFLLWESLHFDSDQAINGIMALRISRLEDLPVVMYGQKYMFVPSAYLAALLFKFTGPSIAALKGVEVLLNAVACALLILMLVKDARLTPLQALCATLWLAMPCFLMSSRMVEAAGGNVEPFVWVLLLWVLRERGLLVGMVAGMGAFNREFTLYGVSALLVVELAFERQWGRAWLLKRAASLAGYVAVYSALVEAARKQAIYTGVYPQAQLGSWQSIKDGAAYLWQELLPDLFGASHGTYAEFGVRLAGPAGWLPADAVVRVLAILMGAWVLFTAARQGMRKREQLAEDGALWFLVGVAVQSCLALVFLNPWGLDQGRLRYVLLMLFAPAAATGLVFKHAPVLLQRVTAAVGVVVAGLFLAGTVKVMSTLHQAPPPRPMQELAAALEEHHITVALADYWTAYNITFLTSERVHVASTGMVRIPDDQVEYWGNLKTAVDIQPEPCAANVALFEAGGMHVCRAQDGGRAGW